MDGDLHRAPWLHRWTAERAAVEKAGDRWGEERAGKILEREEGGKSLERDDLRREEAEEAMVNRFKHAAYESERVTVFERGVWRTNECEKRARAGCSSRREQQ